MTAAIAFIALTLGFLAFWLFKARSSVRADKAWKQVSRLLGLELRGGQIRVMEGKYEGVDVRAENIAYTGMDGFDGHSTRYQVAYPSLGLGLRLEREGKLSGVQKALGSQDIELGDRSFDERYLIRGVDGEAVRRFLCPMRRFKIDRLFSLLGDSCVIEDESITFLEPRIENDPKVLLTKILMLVRTARSLVEEQPEGPIDESLAIHEEDQALEAALRRLDDLRFEGEISSEQAG